jgi:phage terminase Nu1 subunit (DNA packaging protein)
MSTTQWEVVDSTDRDYTVSISAEARARLANEQHDLSSDRQRAEILMWTVCASVIAIAALVIKHILGV